MTDTAPAKRAFWFFEEKKPNVAAWASALDVTRDLLEDADGRRRAADAQLRELGRHAMLHCTTGTILACLLTVLHCTIMHHIGARTAKRWGRRG